MPNDKSIILFDGVCNLCNGSVLFIIRHDKKNRFKFASIQSEPGKLLLKKYKIDPLKADTIILVQENKIYLRSSAVLRICRYLDSFYPIFFLFIIIPPFIRNGIYDFIAKNRYKWFGKRETCLVPTEDLRSKFLI